MTSEIAVMNRFGVALAADSAITIGDGKNTKIYQTANKLFEISDRKAVGMMIYNNTEFFGAPWEVAVKVRRGARANRHRGSVAMRSLSERERRRLEADLPYVERGPDSSFGERLRQRAREEAASVAQAIRKTIRDSASERPRRKQKRPAEAASKSEAN